MLGSQATSIAAGVNWVIGPMQGGGVAVGPPRGAVKDPPPVSKPKTLNPLSGVYGGIMRHNYNHIGRAFSKSFRI